MYRQGLADGERAIGPEAFAEWKGEFWGWLETRPYMRARLGLALCQWELGDRNGAVTHLQALLEQNPNDNQGARLILAPWLLQLRRNEELGVLLRQYPEDDSLDMLWARALWTFRTKGQGVQARCCFRTALERSPEAVTFLLGIRPLPKEEPECITIGGEDEAASAARDLLPVLAEDQEAANWFFGEVQAFCDEPGSPGDIRRGRGRRRE